MDFDLLTIGAGSGGVRASRMSAAKGARVAVAESGPLGGTCVNAGCVPKKLLVYGARFAEAFEDARGFGWTGTEARFDWRKLIADKDREISRLNGIYERLLRDAGVTILSGRARLVDEHTVEVAGRRYTAEHILVATGGRPSTPRIPGADLGIGSNEGLALDEFPEKIVIVGGGYIAVEFAGIFNALGAEVNLLYRGPLFLRGFDEDVRATLAEEMSKRGVTMRWSTEVTLVERDGSGLALTTSNDDRLQADQVLFATGRVPNTADLGLEEAGVELGERGEVLVDETFRTSVSHILAIGDCTDKVMLTPVALAEGMAVAETLFNRNPTTVDYETIPTAVFSLPEVATVGLAEDAARQRFDVVDVYRSAFKPMLHTLSGRDERTMMKLVVDAATDRVVGAHMVGHDAGEIIQGVAIAVRAGATKADFDRTIGIHPTAAEEFVTMRTKVDG